MAWDGNNLWIPIGISDTLYVIRPTQGSLPSKVALNQSLSSIFPGASFPYVASYDGENVMIGAVQSGTLALFKATSFTMIRSFTSGAGGVRGIATDGVMFNVGDSSGTKLFQY